MAPHSLATGEIKALPNGTPAERIGNLWQEGPILLVAFRRPGCPLCRDEAVKVGKLQHKLLNDYGMRIVGVVHESIPGEPEAFVESCWPFPLYQDLSKAAFKEIHGGKIKRANPLGLWNPWSKARRDAKAVFHVAGGNMKGAMFVLGGHLVIGTNGQVVFRGPEITYGMFPSVQQILDAADKVAQNAQQAQPKA